MGFFCLFVLYLSVCSFSAIFLPFYFIFMKYEVHIAIYLYHII